MFRWDLRCFVLLLLVNLAASGCKETRIQHLARVLYDLTLVVTFLCDAFKLPGSPQERNIMIFYTYMHTCPCALVRLYLMGDFTWGFAAVLRGESELGWPGWIWLTGCGMSCYCYGLCGNHQCQLCKVAFPLHSSGHQTYFSKWLWYLQ